VRPPERFLEHLTWPEVEAAIERGVDAVYEMRARGPGVIVPMDMLRDITPSGVAEAGEARLGERMVDAVVPRIVQVCREMAGKE
jgi:hypothetical protein